AVMAEVALVDRLDADGVRRVAELGEDGLPLRKLERGGGPQRALASGLVDDRVERISRGRSQRPPPPSRRRPRPRAPARRTSPRTATARRTRRARAGGGRAPRTARCRTTAHRRSSAPAGRRA